MTLRWWLLWLITHTNSNVPFHSFAYRIIEEANHYLRQWCVSFCLLLHDASSFEYDLWRWGYAVMFSIRKRRKRHILAFLTEEKKPVKERDKKRGKKINERKYARTFNTERGEKRQMKCTNNVLWHVWMKNQRIIDIERYS